MASGVVARVTRAAAQAPRRIELDPSSAPREVAALVDAWLLIADEVGKIAADPALVARALAQMGREPQ